MALVQDALVTCAAAWLAIARPFGVLSLWLAVAALLVLAWQLVTLHHPRRIVLDEQGVSFEAYGRTHAFAWSEVTACSVRRFLVSDRVLVRIATAGRASPLRGRYWLFESLEGYESLLAAIRVYSTQKA